MKLKIRDKFTIIGDYCKHNGGLAVEEILKNGYLTTIKGKQVVIELSGINWEETNKLNKIRMTIGENRVVSCGRYEVEWCFNTFYLEDGELSVLNILENNKSINTIKFRKHNYHQQLEIANLILDKLGINVELVEEDVNKEVLEQIEKLESELSKLKGMLK